MAPSKLDNANMSAKLELRRHFLRKYHADEPPRVLDACQGSGTIWRKLREEFDVESYWGVDLKPQKGRLKIDSSRVLIQPGWRENVVDIDTYGSPWKHWKALVETIDHDCTVFLTIATGAFVRTDSTLNDAMGIGRLRVPRTILNRMHDMGVNYLLTMSNRVEIIEAAETLSGNKQRTIMRYIGLRLAVRT